MPGPWDNNKQNNQDSQNDRPAASPQKIDSAADISVTDNKADPRSPWGKLAEAPKDKEPKTNLPPNLEELMRRHERALKNRQATGQQDAALWRRGNHHLTAVALLSLCVLWGATGFYKIEPDEQGVITRFGDVSRLAPPGVGYHLPIPIENVLKPKVAKVNNTAVSYGSGKDKILLPTADGDLVDVDFGVNWLIDDTRLFLFNALDADGTVRLAAQSIMRDIVSQTPADTVRNNRQDIELRARNELQQVLTQYQSGIKIVQVQLQRVDQPPSVNQAAVDAANATIEKDKMISDARIYATDTITRARIDADKMRNDAAIYKNSVTESAKGDAARFAEQYDAYRAAPDATARRNVLQTLADLFKSAKTNAQNNPPADMAK